ncbi:MAG TPA: glycoside hydrolase family 31 protein [Caulobacteraceae bacterium]|nr:glycoside hydrolase family 31 protein [Caulobacteraceae bacterium]
MSLAQPPLFALVASELGRLTLQSDQGDIAHIFVLEPDIIRVMVLPGGTLEMARTWAIAPGADDVPREGRDRFDLSGFSLPAFVQTLEGNDLTLETDLIRLTVDLSGLFLGWDLKLDGEWRRVARDRRTQAYDFGYWDGKVRHYLSRDPGASYYGLGERAGPMDRAGGRYEMRNIDAMGYSARTTDPLYKHIPFCITRRADGAAHGLFYDTLSDCVFDLGRELDNYHGAYRGFSAEHGDLDYYFIAGPRVAEVTRRFTWLTGRPAFPPRWALGYSGSTMSYTDAPDAQGRMDEFLERCAEHDICCDSFHLSSGYTSIGDKRYVFHWNRDKFPDPAAFARRYADQGVRLCANIKPCLLRDHPLFEEARAKGLLIMAPDGEPAWVQFWDEVGAYLDFTHPAAFDWWKGQVSTALLDQGIVSTWNDNNEFEIWTPNAMAHGFGAPFEARRAKPLQTLLMLKASREAQIAHAPAKRPFLVSRAGAAGMQRYVQTWSGDNFTSWETLKYNIKMGLGLALSGVSNTGHDIGGFSGPAPDAELLVRWVQFGVFMPRFSIHSWNDDGAVNAPWMHPEATPFIRDLIKLRLTLLPYLYTLLRTYHADYEPVVRPTFHDFPDDPLCWAENDEMMLGAGLLVAPVVEPGATVREVYLPAGAAWREVWSGERHEGGRSVILPAPWDRPPLLAREGGAIPVNLAEQHFARPADARGFWMFPHQGEGAFTAVSYEDDGETRDGPDGAWRLEVRSDARTIRVTVERRGTVPDGALTLIFPASEDRAISVRGHEAREDRLSDGRRRVVVAR